MVEFVYRQPLHNCEYCGLEYWKTSAYIKHLIELHNADLPKCSFCHKQFLSNKGLQEHMDDVHTTDGGIKRHKCLKCSSTFKWLRDLKNHLARKHGPNAKPVLQCKHCGLKFYQRIEYTEHVLGVHWKRQIFQCEICSYKFKYRSQLIKHIQIKHGSLNEWKKCNFCPASYKWTRDLEIHYQQKHRALLMKTTTHTGNPISYECDVCSQSFNSKENLVSHLIAFHLINEGTSNSLQKCSQCSEVFKTRKLLSQHTLVHDIEFLNRDTGKTTERPDRLIIVPNSFPENIVDFEVELRRRLEYRNLIEIRENISENDSSRKNGIGFRSRNLNEKKLVNDDVILATSTDLGESEMNGNIVNNLGTTEKSTKIHESTSDSDERLFENSNDCDKFQLKDLKIVFVRLEGDIMEKAKEMEKPSKPGESHNMIGENTLLPSTTIKQHFKKTERNATENFIDISNVCQESSLETKPETDLKNEKKSKKHSKLKLKELKIILMRIEDEKSLILQPINNSKQLKDSPTTLKNTINNENSKQLNVNENTSINEPLINNIFNEHSIAKFHSCEHCRQKFRVKESLDHHILEDHSNSRTLTHKCQICDADFPFRYYLRLHLKGEHLIIRKKRQVGRTSLTCKTCKMKFKTKHSYNIHIKHMHLKTVQKTLRCRTCDKVCNNRMILIRHYRLEHNRIHKCEQCSSVFDSIDLLQEHIEYNHSNTLCYKCKICTATYTRKVRLEEHIQLKHRNRHRRLILENDIVKTPRVKKINRVRVLKIQKRESRLKALKTNPKKGKKIKTKPFQTTVKQSNSKFLLESDYPEHINDNTGHKQHGNDRSDCTADTKNISMDKRRSRKQQTIKHFVSKFNRKRILEADKIKNKKLKLDGESHSVSETEITNEKLLVDQSIHTKQIRKQKSILKLKEIYSDNENSLKVKSVSKHKSVSFQLDEVTSQTNNDFGNIDEVKLYDKKKQMRENVADNMNNDVAVKTVDHLSDDVADISEKKNNENINSYYCRQDNNSDLDQLLEESSMICTDMEDAAIIYDNSKEIRLKKRVHLKQNYTIQHFKCEMCHAIFETKKLLFAHIRNHEKVQNCFVCNATFKRKGDLTRHITKSHQFSLLKNSPVGVLKHILRDHSYCKRVMNKNTIVENIITYENLTKPISDNDSKNHQYKCNYCVSHFLFAEKLQQHMKQFHKITSKVDMSRCNICNIIFNSKEHLCVHEKLVHPVAQIEENKNNESTPVQGEDEIQGKRFKWKKALAQTYESETIY